MRHCHEMRNITDMYYPSHKSWWVRFYGKNKEMFAQKSFTYSKYGGKDLALKTAHEWRDLTEERLIGEKKFTVPRNPLYYKTPFKNNKSGAIGVHFTSIRNAKRSRGNYDAWVATWVENKQPKNRKFRVDIYGFSKARKLAIAWRIFQELKLNLKRENPNINNYQTKGVIP